MSLNVTFECDSCHTTCEQREAHAWSEISHLCNLTKYIDPPANHFCSDKCVLEFLHKIFIDRTNGKIN